MTTQERKVQLGIGVDATGAKAGFDQVKAGAKDMAQAVGQAGKEAAKGLDGVGDGGANSAKKIEAATRTMIGSVQRATAAMESGGRGTAQYLETIAKQRGADASALKPYLDQLRQVEAAQAAATGTLNKMGVSAGQTAQALRQVPAQFSDIVISLQSGQAPLTVLLQQGSQLKDSFGGVGNAARALGGYIVGLASPFTIAAAAVGVLSYGYLMGAKEAENHSRALILSGNAAGTTASQMSAAAQRIGALVGTQGNAAAALDAMAQSGAVGAANLERFTTAAVQFERVTGTAIDDTVKSFAELKKAPLEASLKLNESMNYLTASLYSQIKALDEQGRSTEAADLAQRAFADTLTSRAGEMERQLGLIERSWRAVKDAISGAGESLLDIGRPIGLDAQIAAQRKLVADLEKPGATMRKGLNLTAVVYDSDVAKAKEALAILEESARIDARRVNNRADEASLVKLLAGYEKEQEQYKSKSQRRDEEIQRAQIEGARLVSAGLLSQKQLELDIANIREKYADKAVKTRAGDPFAADRAAAQEWAQYYESFTSLTDKATGKTQELSAAQLKLQQYLVSPAYANATEEMRQLVLQQAYGAVSAEKLATSQAALAKAQTEFGNSRDAELKRAGAEIVTLEGRAQALEDEVLAYGLGKEAVEAMTIARLEERKAILQQFDGSGQQIELLEQEIAARKRLAAAQDSLAGQQASEKAAKKAQEDWQRAADKIENSITDALMRGFESGKSFAENMRDVVVNMFKSMVLRPVVSAIVSPLAGALAGNPALASQGGGVGNVFSGFNTGLTSYLAGGLSYVGNLFGSNAVSSFAAGMANKSVMGPAIAAYTEAAAAATAAGNSAAAASYATTAKGLSAGSSTAGSLGWMGWVLAGMQASGDMYDAGSRWDNKYTALDPGQTIKGDLLSALGVDGRTAAVLTGSSLQQAIFNKMFGEGAKEINASGITGTFAGSSFSGQSYQEWSRSGSWFKKGSSGTDYAALDSSYSASLGKIYGSVASSTAELAAALGLPTSQILGYVKSIRLDSSQLTEAGLKAVFEGIADELARTVVSADYIREGERASATLTRLTTSLATVNGAFDVLDKAALSASLAGGDSASKLVDLLGGMNAFGEATLSYYQAFYTEAERNAKTTEQLVAQFAGLGVAVPDSLQAYRDLVNAQDITTESGRATYAALMGLSGAFATVTNAATKAVNDLIKTSDYATYIDYASAVSKAGGTPLPRFAGGGDHTGGLRMVGERGWEVEGTGPARIWNQQQLGAALGSGGAATAEEVAALREEQRAQAAAMVSRLADLLDIVKKWEGIGMPEVRPT